MTLVRSSSLAVRLLSFGLLVVIALGPYLHYASGSGRPGVSVRFADSYAMPLPAIPIGSGAPLAPVAGVIRVLVVAAEFPDFNHTVTIDAIKHDYFTTVTNYYQEVSYGAVSFQGDVAGWVRLPHPMSYYARDCTAVDDADCGGSPTTWWIARDAATILGSTVKWNNYDYFVFLHSGPGEESTRTMKDAPWSVTYLAGVYIQTAGKTIFKFNVVPEEEASGAVPIGVYIHEFGHQLGLPDLYNTLTGQTIMGPWSLMDKGLWNGNPPGSDPSQMEAWSKIKLGWLNGSMLAVANQGAFANYTVDPLEVTSNDVHAIKIPIYSSTNQPTKQYYLVEVRQQIGFDKGLPSTGVLITKADERLSQVQLTVINGHADVPGLQDATWNVGQVFTDGQNNIAVAITGQVGDAYQITVNRAGPMSDLAVTKIYTQPTAVQPNTTVTILADIANLGTVTASNVPVEIDLDGQPYASKQVTLSAGASTEISTTWVAVTGSHNITVIIDPYDTITELSRANNVMTYILNVGPIVIITVPLNVTTGNATAWVKINGIQYTLNGTNSVSVSVATGPTTIEVEPNIYESNDTRQTFISWSDNNTQNPRQLSVTNTTSLTALYNTQYLVDLYPNGGTTTGGGWYYPNSNVTVFAVSPSNLTQQVSRLIFNGWSGDVNSNETSVTITVNKPYKLAADWKQQYYVTVVSPVNTAFGSGWYDAGTPATISIPSTIVTQNNTRQVFIGWNGTSSTASSQTIKVNAPTVVQANWKTQYLVQINSQYGTPQGSGWQDSGTQVQVSIQPEVDYPNQTRRIFIGWSGDYFGTSPTVLLTVNSQKTLSANWQTQYQLSFRVDGVPNGTIAGLNLKNVTHDLSQSTPYSDWFNAGEQVSPAINDTLTQGFLTFQFAGWHNSTGTKIDPPITVTGPMDYTASYQASFFNMPMLPIPGFPDEAILLGFAIGLISLAFLRRRRSKQSTA